MNVVHATRWKLPQLDDHYYIIAQNITILFRHENKVRLTQHATSGARQNLKYLDATTNQTTSENIYTYRSNLQYIDNLTKLHTITSTIEYIIDSELEVAHK